MLTFFISIHTIVRLLLVIVILMQASRGGGLSGTFGSTMTSAIMGGRSAASFLSKLTTWLAIAFFGLAVIISLISAPSIANTDSLLRKEAESKEVTPGADLSLPSLPNISDTED